MFQTSHILYIASCIDKLGYSIYVVEEIKTIVKLFIVYF